MTVWENLASEALRSRALSSGGFMKKGTAVSHAEELIASVRHPVPRGLTPKRSLLSGGNMQKLILARALSPEPRFILANQPARGLDEGAIAYVQSQLLTARERGAAILLISEDLDELLALTDRLAVIQQGRLSEARPTSILDCHRSRPRHVDDTACRGRS